MCFFCLMIRPPPGSTLFPYTTLFRSASAKTGIGVDNILESIIENIPAPEGNKDKPLQALIFDSHYDVYRGVVLHVRIFNGSIRTGMKIKMLKSELEFEALQVGVFLPAMKSVEELMAGEVGFISTNIKIVSNVKVGDTLINPNKPDTNADRKSVV